MSIETVNDETFAARIQPEGTTLVEFGAEWCPPCKTLLPMLGELSHEQGSQVRFLQVDCDESPETASRYRVMSVPTVIVFRDGEPVEKLVGLRPKSVYEQVLSKHG
ncbi:thioredoxin family protein [Paenibacillus sp. FSL M7-1455]|uniref:thioredoxin family protein n=1 Tax=Paenibacillus sp. FSL M7-1455 TaxID=2975316 RepID=UPI000542372D|nr:Thioredoxin [Paenibacillus sp. P1XP2]HWO53966.1 thioredoxin family protein [Paenibacillus cookii]